MLPAPESFCYKRFFQLCGLSSKTPKEIQDVFHILDDDNSGYIEESELKCVKQCCKVNYTCETCSSGNSQRSFSHVRLWAMRLRDVRDGGGFFLLCVQVLPAAVPAGGENTNGGRNKELHFSSWRWLWWQNWCGGLVFGSFAFSQNQIRYIEMKWMQRLRSISI